MKFVLPFLNTPGKLLLWVPALLMLFLSLPSRAQFYNGYQMEFGRSRVQFDEFLWTYYKFDRFDTYFYLNGKELALHTARYADSELARMESDLETYLEGKIQFLIFNNLNDLKQSNIGLTTGTQYNVGGVSHILGNKVVLYFDGSMINFEQQIRRGIAHILLQNAIFGNNIGSQVMNSFLQNFPEWYTQGLIAYLAEEWNTRIDNRIRNAIKSGKYKKFNRLIMDENLVTDAGHSFWRFIAEKYGKANVVSVINMTRVSRSIETGFQYVLGITLDTLFEEWKAYYSDIYNAESADRSLPSNEEKLTGKRVLKRNDKNRKYTELQIGPTGEYAAFVTNETGKYKVWLHHFRSNKIKKIYTGGYRLDEKVDYTYPLLTWHPTGRILTMALEKKGLIWLYFYDIEEKDFTKQNIFGFQKVTDLSYTDDGRTLVLSAVKNGQSDLFLFHIASGSTEQLTNDIYDDINPQFIDNSTRIIFSSNRPGDTLNFGEKLPPVDVDRFYDVFIFNFRAGDPVLRRVTNTPLANEIQPMKYNRKGYFTYMSDQNGIYNAYIARLDSAVAYVDTTVHYRYFTRSFPVTNYSRNMTEHHVSPDAGMKAWVIDENLYNEVYVSELLPPSELQPEELTFTTFMQRQLAQEIKKPVSRETPTQQPEKSPMQPQPQQQGEQQRKSFRNVMRNDTYQMEADGERSPREGRIDLENYHLDKQGIVDINMPDTLNALSSRFKVAADTTGDEFVIPKQRNFYTQYSINELVTQIDFSYLNQMYQPYSASLSPNNQNGVPGFDVNPSYDNPGLSPTFKVGVTDLMEDYRIMGGVRLGLDLVNKEYFFNFANLKKRLDKEFVFMRRSLEQIALSELVSKQKINEGYFILTWPFTRVLRIRSTFLFRNENYITTGTREAYLREPDFTRNWGGAKLQLIYDDSRELGLNLLEGSRFMIFAEYNQLVDDLERNLFVLGFDMRNYTKIHRQFIWANRIAGSTNFGTEKLLYFMGATDSWMFPKFGQDTRIDPEMNWVYQALATNMRGFNQNARNGNNFVLINSEFRMPVFKYLLNKPIKSELVKNFQVVAFGDIGTAWTGWNPYDEDNVLYTRYETSGPLRIRVQYEKDPIIGGVGFGARTKLLGYFLKADVAWGIEDGEIKSKPKFYLSMSLDF